jgi:thiosulfate/3-mercaptopyruvate sulfurtransferase
MNPQHLAETAWLQDHLDDPDLRVLDCTVFLRPVEGGVRPESGRAQWEQAHIPGAGFADLIGDLSDKDTHLPIMMPPAAQFADAMERYGVGDDSRVVLYDAATNVWAARVWWMLRAFGFERAAVLNGGWKKWTLEKRPTSSGVEPSRPRARFTARPQAALIADWKEVRAALDDPGVRLVNALSADEHSGKVTRVARPGHIPGSVNVPAGSLVDPATNAYRDPAELRAIFERAGLPGSGRVIAYCGGGIAACGDALALTLLGAKDVAVYDGSLVDWSSRAELPMETG